MDITLDFQYFGAVFNAYFGYHKIRENIGIKNLLFSDDFRVINLLFRAFVI